MIRTSSRMTSASWTLAVSVLAAALLASPGAARRAGLVPVYQEPALIPDLDIAGNLRLRATPRVFCVSAHMA